MLYEREIGLLHGKRERNDDDEADEDLLDEEQVLDVVRESVRSVFTGPVRDLGGDANIFMLGLDSLQVLELSRSLSRRFGQFRASTSETTRAIYENPTISKLVHAIQSRITSKVESKHEVASREERISAMVHKYTLSFSRRKQHLQLTPDSSKPATDQPSGQPESASGYTVLLTGSTGSLGTYLLHSLLDNPQISHIYCLNRTPNAAEKQSRSFLDRGLKFSQLEPAPPSPPHSASDSDTNPSNENATTARGIHTTTTQPLTTT